MQAVLEPPQGDRSLKRIQAMTRQGKISPGCCGQEGHQGTRLTPASDPRFEALLCRGILHLGQHLLQHPAVAQERSSLASAAAHKAAEAAAQESAPGSCHSEPRWGMEGKTLGGFSKQYCLHGCSVCGGSYDIRSGSAYAGATVLPAALGSMIIAAAAALHCCMQPVSWAGLVSAGQQLCKVSSNQQYQRWFAALIYLYQGAALLTVTADCGC